MQAFTGGGQLENFSESDFSDLSSPQNEIQHFDLSSVETTGDFRLRAESKFSNKQNFVTLDWSEANGVSDGYVVERTNDNVSWTTPPTNYGKQIKILNVYPDNCNFLKRWMDQIDPATGQPVSMGLINVEAVRLEDFNKNASYYLKKGTANYQYDGIYFGSEDVNGGYVPGVNDLTAASQPVVADFGRTGRSLIFGHDTILAGDHPYFNRFAGNLDLFIEGLLPPGFHSDIPRNDVGSRKVKFVIDGFLNKYPYALSPDATFTIMPAHTVGQYFNYRGTATRWMQFIGPLTPLGAPGGRLIEPSGVYNASNQKVGDNNWYLVTKNNYAQIQTGHSITNDGIGACTPDEAKIIANMIYYTSTLNLTTHGEDRTVLDTAKPDSPTISGRVEGDQATLSIGTTDKGIDYYYRVKAKTNFTTKISDTIKVPVISGVKGYIYKVDSDPNGAPTITRNPTTQEVTNINLNPASGGSQASLSVSRMDADKYLHILAVDNANNVSDVKTIKIYDYLWWKYDSGVLTIYPHEINANVDAIVDNTDPLVPVVTWPWAPYISQITKSVIKPGVSGKESIAQLFNGFTKMTTIEGLTNLETSQVTDFNRLFNDCQSLSSIDLSRMNTKIAIDMFRFMRNCKNITSLTYGPNFNTSTVVNIGGFFEGMHKMTSFDLSHIDTRSATNMMGMFADCKSLKSIDISSFDTSKVVDMQWLFCIDDELEAVNLGNINTSSLTTMNRMFYDDPKLKSIKFGNIDTSKVTVMTELFKGCSSLGSLDLSSFTINPTTNINDMFVGTDSLWQLKMGSGTKITNAAGLQDPVAGTAIKDYDNPTPVYYATTNKWQEVGAGTFHNPQGSKKSSTDIVGESGTRSDVRTYVWDQEGEQTLTVGSSIDFGTHRGSKLDHDYVSSEQPMKLKDNRNARNGKRWRIEAKVSKPLTLVNDSSKKISGAPLYHQDTTSNVLTNLTSVNKTIYSKTAGSTFSEEFSHPWKMKFRASPSTIPAVGKYKGEVTYTLINEAP